MTDATSVSGNMQIAVDKWSIVRLLPLVTICKIKLLR